MLQDAIALLGIANPQLSLAWQDGGLPSEDSTRPLRLASDPAAGRRLARSPRAAGSN